MRPRQLTMQAFGPYENKTTIDFDKLTENSQLFLITGDTGAGKTMIFDAISFALFGSDSGKIRDTQDLRSSFADDRIATEVVLRFEHAGTVYVITRGERRWNQRSDKPLTNPDSYVELKYDDGSVIADKAGTVKDKITEILGMDQVQFEQVTMIAQGQFRQLLSASSDERKKLLTQLFRTEKFGQLIKKIRDEKKDAEKNLDSINVQISTVGGTIALEPEMNPEEHQELWNYTDANTLKTAVNSLSELVDLQERTYKDASCKANELNSELGDLQKKAGKLDNLAEIYDNYQLKMKEFPQVETRKEQADQQWEKVSKNKTEIEELGNQISVKTSRLDDYTLLDNRNTSLSNNLRQQELLQSELEQKNNEISEKSKTLESKKSDQNRLRGTREEQTLQLEQLSKMRDEYKDYLCLSKEIQKMDSQCSDLKIKKKEMKEAQNISLEHDESYVKSKRLYYDNLAGILAEGLADGEACPVCGAFHHPNLAEKDPQAPSKEQLEEAQKERDKLDKAASKAGGVYLEAHEAFDKQKKSVMKKMLNFFGDGENLAVPIEEWRHVVAEKLDSIKKEGKKEREKSDFLQKQIDDLNKLEKEIPELEEAIKKQETEASEKQQTLSKLKGEETRLQEELRSTSENMKKAGLVKNSRKEAQEEIDCLVKKKTELQNALDAAKTEKNAAEQAYALTQKEITSDQKRLKGFNPEEQRALDQQLKDKQAESEKLYDQAAQLHGRLSANKNAKEKLQSLSSQFIAAEERFRQLKELDDAASATTSGQGDDGRVAFDIFVLQAYFDQVLSRANQRLYTMSGKRYRLFRRQEAKNKKSQTGLDIDVHDGFTGSDRHAETLSGGESFLASMALALGFSDVVQEHAGGVRIESLFIDEGFGTLDEDSLNKAIMVLEDLAGADRMVAVISHVDELKEKLENQLVVEKNQGKSSTVRIITPTTGI